MDEISRQLKSEIQALQDYIERTADRYLATVWVSQLLPLFERLEEHLGEGELQEVLTAFHHAQHHFAVNGLLAPQIQVVLDRYEDLVAHLPAVASPGGEEGEPNDAVLFPESDPEVPPPLSTHLLFEEEDEELAEVIEVADPEPESADETSLFTPLDLSEAPPAMADPTPGLEKGSADLLFKGYAPADRPASAATKRGPPVRPSAAPARPSGGSSKKPDKRTTPRPIQAKPKDPELQVDIFAAKISLDELQVGLGISLPKSDIANLQVRMRDKIASDEIPALSAHQPNAGQYILVPRLTRFVHKDQLYPCTVKNLAKIFSGIFGDIRDLVRYRECSFMNYEYPELGWSLVTAESVREGLDKNYMEQNQFLRYLATTTGVPSHRVRRRLLVEAVYDLIVGCLVLGKRFQQQTIDWTASGPSKNEFVCLYYPSEGIRIRDLPRTARHHALGVCPNW